MSIFGILWFLIILWDFVKKPVANTVFLTIFFMTFQSTNVLYLNGTGIGPGVLTSIVLILKIFFVQKFKIRKIKQAWPTFLTALMMVLASSLSLIYNGILSKNLMLFIQLLTYILCFLSIQFIRKDISEEFVYRAIRRIIIFHSVFGFIQVLSSTNILPLRGILDIIFYNDPSTDVVFHRAFYPRIMSTFMEPSYAAGFFVGAFFFLLLYKFRIKQNIWILLLLFIEILLTQSSTAYGAFIVGGLILILFSHQFTLKQKIFICGGSIIGLIILYYGFYSLLDAVIFSKSMTGSYRTRERFNNNSIEAFLSSPIFGIGYKNCRGSSIVYSLLGQMGIIGLLVYVLFNLFVLFSKSNDNQEDRYLVIASKVGVLSAIVCQVIACPDLDLCTYWLWLYVFSISLRGTKSHSAY